MIITKFLHSCLLVEEQGKTFLFDPGNYSESALDITNIHTLDYILITHSHPDHLYLPLLQKIVNKFPHASIITNQSIKDMLATENISAEISGNEIIKLEDVPHEKIWTGQAPENTMITIFNKLTHPGDSLSFEIPDQVRDDEGIILALPITAPWGHTTWAVEKALEIKPKVIIPIHDFMWKDEVRTALYDRLEDFFSTKGIQFIKCETGKIFKI